MPSQRPESEVLANYAPALNGLSWTPVAGGFSGAGVWRGDDAITGPVFAVKAWPPEFTSTRLATLHTWMAQAARLAFVPAVLRTIANMTSVSHLGRVWDVTRWMPGTALANPGIAEVEAACVAVAQLHGVWPSEHTAACPGVLNRLRALSDFRTQLGSGVPPRPRVSGAIIPLVRRAFLRVAESADWAERVLRPWEYVPLPLSPCVRDMRAEHVLFTSGRVAGIVDYGAMAIDHPAVDLARLLGDFDGHEETRITAGLRAYRSERSLDVPDDFVRVLEQTGTICSVVGWLMRLLVEQRKVADERAVSTRLERLVGRIEQFAPK